MYRALTGIAGKLGLLAALAIAATALIVARPSAEGERASPRMTAASEVVVIPAPAAAVQFALPAEAYDLEYDVARNRIFWTVSRPSGTDELVEFDPSTRSIVSATVLPDVEYNGYLTRLRIAPDGSVWVGQPYRLVRVDPESGAVASVDLAAEVGPTTEPLDSVDSLEGTWISSFAFRSDEVIVARNNVPYLTRFDHALRPLGEIDVPGELAGSADMVAIRDVIYATAGYSSSTASVWTIDMANHAEKLGFEARRLEPAGDRLIASGSSGLGVWAPSGESVLQDREGSENVRVAAAPSGDKAVVYDPAANAVLSVESGRVTAQVDLGRAEATEFNPLGVPMRVRIKPRVNDIVWAGDMAWYIDGTALRLVGLSI